MGRQISPMLCVAKLSCLWETSLWLLTKQFSCYWLTLLGDFFITCLSYFVKQVWQNNNFWILNRRDLSSISNQQQLPGFYCICFVGNLCSAWGSVGLNRIIRFTVLCFVLLRCIYFCEAQILNTGMPTSLRHYATTQCNLNFYQLTRAPYLRSVSWIHCSFLSASVAVFEVAWWLNGKGKYCSIYLWVGYRVWMEKVCQSIKAHDLEML